MKGEMLKKPFFYTYSGNACLWIVVALLLSACGTTPSSTGTGGAGVQRVEFNQSEYDAAIRLMKDKRYKKAAGAFESIVRKYPDRAGPRINLGIAYREQKRFEDARKALQKATQTDPKSAIAYNELGLVYRKLGNFDKARAAYQKSIRNRSRYSPAYRNLGILCDIYLQDLSCAIRNYRRYDSLTRSEDKQVSLWIVDLKKRVRAPTKRKQQ